MANTHLQKTFSPSANRTRQTISVWVKRTGGLGTTQAIFSVYTGGTYYAHLRFKSDDSIQLYNYNDINIRTNRKFRDTNGWYHIHVIIDTPNSTSTDRIRLYVNGERETDLSNTTYPAQNGEIKFGDSNLHSIGSYDSGSYFDGCMSHFHFITNNAYEPTLFGETDSTTGEWKIKTSPSVTYSTNSFFILKDGNSGTDQSGQSNDFSVTGGTLTKTEDNPSNVFATLNPLNYTSSAIAYANGNTKAQYPGSWIATLGTIGAKAGKYYWEAKVVSGNNANLFYGISTDAVDLDTSPQNKAGVISQHINGDRYVDTTYTAGAAQALVNGDILGVALDLDSSPKTVKFYKNGSLLTSSSSVNLTSTFDDEFVFPIFIGNNSSASSTWEVNFGNGFFATTQISSEGTNASGIGKFEHNVPANHTALCTKGLNE